MATIDSAETQTPIVITATNTTQLIQFNPASQLPIKLQGSPNFPTWKAQITMLLHGHDLYGHLDGSTPAPPQTVTEDNVQVPNQKYKLWFRQDRLIQNAIMASVDPTIAPTVAAAPTSKTAWDLLHTSFANKSQTRIFGLRDQLSRVSKGTTPVTDYLRKIKSISDELATAGSPISNEEMIVKILSGLGAEYREISAAIRARDSPITFEELFDKLLDYELFLTHAETKNLPPITAAVANISNTSQPLNRNPNRGRQSSWRPQTNRPLHPQHQVRASVPNFQQPQWRAPGKHFQQPQWRAPTMNSIESFLSCVEKCSTNLK